MTAGIVLLPPLFAWFTLRRGHSKLSRILSFGWLGFMLLFMALGEDEPPTRRPAPIASPAPAAQVATAPKAQPSSAPEPTSEGPTKAQVAEAQRILKDAEAVVKQGKAMEPLRQTSNTDALAKCGALMREWQPKAEALSADAMKLPLELRVHVVAPAEAVMCVSCARDAMDACTRSASSLRDGRSALAKL